MKISGIRNSLILVFVFSLIFGFNYIVNAAGKSSGTTVIQYQGKDGFNITGVLDVPNEASVKKKVPLVIFLHSLGGSKRDWKTLPNLVKGLGCATLNIDLRGHGQSILDRRSKKRYWPNFKNLEFSKYPDDVNQGIKYIKDNYPEINVSKIAIIGSDIGANTAILAGSKDFRKVKALILLSPTSFYKGLDTRIPLADYGIHPVLIIVSQSDRYAYNDSTDLIKYAQGKKQLKVYPFGGSGVDLLQFQPESKSLIVDWIKTNFI
ncbi:MAG: alpha/beta fold hydrolase [Candidatus Gastranaerophilales bacterium]|nr:alpha/beta fold hydrolase [Candidatus Gastranaerophilales bacterium]